MALAQRRAADGARLEQIFARGTWPMASRRRLVRWTLAATAVVLGGYVAYLARGDRSLDRAFREVSEGATRAEVVALLGPPDAVREGCRDLPTWMNRPVVDAVCAQELEFHATLRAVAWTVGFNEQGRAIAKYRYIGD
jgi:hypothetical protein